MAQGGSITWRIALNGADQVKKDLRDLGPTGKKAAKELDDALKRPASGLAVIDGAGKQVRQSMEGMAGRMGAVGEAMGGLGALGLAAAAGLAAVGVAATAALNVAKDAMAYADDVADSAAKIGVGVEALQEWRLVARALGAEMGDADAALEGFMKTFGAARSGLSAKAMKPFEALGFTKEELKNVDDADKLLSEVIDRISGLGNAAEQAAVAEKLGLGPLLPVIREGKDAIAATVAEMRSLGVVMDAEMIKRGADAQAQFETLSTVIDMNLKSAFIDLAPAIIQIIHLLADGTRAMADFVDSFRDLEDRSTRKLQEQQRNMFKVRQKLLDKYGFEALEVRRSAPVFDQQRYEDVRDKMDEVSAVLANRQTEAMARQSGSAGGRVTLVDVSGGGSKRDKGPKGPSAEDRQRNYDQQMAQLQMALLDMTGADLKTAEERARFAEERLKLEKEQKLKAIENDKTLDADQKKLLTAQAEALYAAKAANVRADNFELIQEERYKLAREQLERERDLAAARGDYKMVEKLDHTLAALDDARDMVRDGMSPEEAKQKAADRQAELIDAERQGEFRDFFKGAFKAALDGDLGGFLQRWMSDYTTRALEQSLNQIADLVMKIFSDAVRAGGSGGGGFSWGDAFNAAASALGFGGGGSSSAPVPHRAAGGGFGPGWLVAGEHGPELLRLGMSGYAYDAAETRTAFASQRAGGGPAIGKFELHNHTGVQARAQVERDSDGALKVSLYPVLQGAVGQMWRDGSMQDSMRGAQPRAKRRG